MQAFVDVLTFVIGANVAAATIFVHLTFDSELGALSEGITSVAR